MSLPTFKYHPNPLSTDVITKSNEVCECCNQARGYVYSCAFYSVQEIEFICPWCIADGSAANKFDGTFNDDLPLRNAGISEEIISQVCKQTPGYISWQQDEWQTHCNDACEFHGDASITDVKKLLSSTNDDIFINRTGCSLSDLNILSESYKPGENPAIYKFKCRKCNKEIFTLDCS